MSQLVTGVDRLSQQIMNGRLRLGANENLVGKEPFANADQGLIYAQQQPRHYIVPDRLWKRCGNAAEFQNLVTGLVEGI